jgi:membrane fusion protein (multidrug efflux system)
VSTTNTGTAAGGNAPIRRTALIKPLIILVVIAAIVLGGIFAFQTFKGKMIKKFMAAGASAPQSVSTVVASSSAWQDHLQAVGSLRAVRGADLAPQASGVVDTIRFESGADVAKGAILLTLRPNDDPAKLAQLQAAADLAEQNYKRDQEQFAAQAISQATLDSDLSTLKSARAQVAAQQALIDEKIVRAPFAGRLGIRQIDEGQYLTAGTTVVTLQALDPIYVDFYVPQQALAELRTGEPVTATVDTYPNAPFTGVITSINSKVDSTSRNVQVRASFANADRRLVPGMYANVEIASGAARTLVTLPQSAITHNPYGDTVYLVQTAGADDKGNAKSTVQQRFVKLGPTRGDQVAVDSGVVNGDVVVTGGQMKLRNGVTVIVNNTVKPADDIAPSPPNE